MIDFQSEFVFGLHGKRYEDFYTYIAKPELEIITGANDFEVIGFEKHLSFKDFENKKVSIFPNFYTSFLSDIAKVNGKVTFRKKVCISLDERLCNDICPKTDRKISIIKIAGIELAYFVYFDIKEFYDFVYDDCTKAVQHEIIPIISSENIPKIPNRNSDSNNLLDISKAEKHESFSNDRNEKSIYKSFAELAAMKNHELDNNQINDLSNQGNQELKEIIGYIHNHNFERKFSFIRISVDGKGFPIPHVIYPEIANLKIGTVIKALCEYDETTGKIAKTISYAVCFEKELDIEFEIFEGELERRIGNSFAFVTNTGNSIYVPPNLARNFEESRVYIVECLSVQSYDRNGNLSWEAIEIYNNDKPILTF